MNYSVLIDKYKKSRDLLVRRRAEREATKGLLEQEELTLKALSGDLAVITDSIAVVQNFSSNIRTDVVKKFEELLTSGIREVFNKDYKVSIEFTTSGNSYYADFYIILPDGRKVGMSHEGGGLRDFVSVLQRILYIIMEPSKPSKILFMDENLKHLDAERSALGFKFISGLLRELGIQTVFITHSMSAKGLSDANINIIEVSKSPDDTQSVINTIKGVGHA